MRSNGIAVGQDCETSRIKSTKRSLWPPWSPSKEVSTFCHGAHLVTLNLLESAVGLARRHVVRVAPAAGGLPRPAGLHRRPLLRPAVHRRLRGRGRSCHLFALLVGPSSPPLAATVLFPLIAVPVFAPPTPPFPVSVWLLPVSLGSSLLLASPARLLVFHRPERFPQRTRY